MERDESNVRKAQHPLYFNSHAHVERDVDRHWEKRFENEISTHTLTWSVTRNGENQRKRDQNFNSHAHVERDRKLGKQVHFNVYFNSHAHVERDRTAIGRIADQKSISTHTLTWSVTKCTEKYAAQGIFQLTRSRGA